MQNGDGAPVARFTSAAIAVVLILGLVLMSAVVIG
jgi:hypothetical protein